MLIQMMLAAVLTASFFLWSPPVAADPLEHAGRLATAAVAVLTHPSAQASAQSEPVPKSGHLLLGIAIDVSSSFGELHSALQLLRNVVSQLVPGDVVILTVYDLESRALVNLRIRDKGDVDAILSALENIDYSSVRGTDIGKAFRFVTDKADKYPNIDQRVFLMVGDHMDDDIIATNGPEPSLATRGRVLSLFVNPAQPSPFIKRAQKEIEDYSVFNAHSGPQALQELASQLQSRHLKSKAKEALYLGLFVSAGVMGATVLGVALRRRPLVKLVLPGRENWGPFRLPLVGRRRFRIDEGKGEFLVGGPFKPRLYFRNRLPGRLLTFEGNLYRGGGLLHLPLSGILGTDSESIAFRLEGGNEQ